MKVAIVGGGVAGLAAAHRLLKSAEQIRTPLEVTIFEASDRLGGIIETVHVEGTIVELGPDSFTTLKPGALKLCREIGLSANLLSTNNSYRRAFIARNGALNPIPQGFVMIAPGQFDTFFKSNILSRTGKLRMACEQFIAPSEQQFSVDESVASFVTRRFGPEAAKCIAQPMLGGIYTGDINKLSLRATLPKFVDYEKKFGNVAAGLRRENKSSAVASANTASTAASAASAASAAAATSAANLAAAAAPPTDIGFSSHQEQSGGARYSAFVTLDAGMNLLVQRLKECIGSQNIRCYAKVTRLEKLADGHYILYTEARGEEIFDRVILAVPAKVASRLLARFDSTASEALAKIEYASSVVACLLVARSSIKHALDGFGFVVPQTERRSILACSFSSIKFVNRCSDDKVLLRVFIGGVLNPAAWQLPDDELLRMVKEDLDYYLGLEGPIERHWIKRWPDSMPQYNVGHLDRAQSIEQSLVALGGIYYAGAGLRGVGVPDCISSGETAARSIITSLQ